MEVCGQTGITKPECSCLACLNKQVQEHRPGLVPPKVPK